MAETRRNQRRRDFPEEP